MAEPIDVTSPEYQQSLGNDAEVYVVSPTGKRQIIPRSQLDLALAGGYKLESYGQTQDARLQREYGDSAGQAFLEGAARGITLGLSDATIGQLDEEGFRERRDRNRGAALGGEIVGSVLPMGAGGLIGGAGRAVGGAVTARAGAGLGARVLGGAAAGATEGAIFGAGQGVSELSLADDPLTAERVVSTLGSNVLYGAAFGGAAGGAGSLLSEAAKAGSKYARQLVESRAAKTTAKVGEDVADDVLTMDRPQLREAAKVEVAAIKAQAKKDAEAVLEDVRKYAEETRSSFVTTDDKAVAKVLGSSKARLMRSLDDPRGWIDEPFKAKRTAEALRMQEDALVKAMGGFDKIKADAIQQQDFLLKSLPANPTGTVNLSRSQTQWFASFKGIDDGGPGAFMSASADDVVKFREALAAHEVVPPWKEWKMIGKADEWLAKNRAAQERIKSFTDALANPQSERLTQLTNALDSFGERMSATGKAEGIVGKATDATIGGGIATGAMALGVPAPVAFMIGGKVADIATSQVMRRLGNRIGKAAAGAGETMAAGVDKMFAAAGKAGKKLSPVASRTLNAVSFATADQVAANPVRPYAATKNARVQAFRDRERELQAITQPGLNGKPMLRISAAKDLAARLAGVATASPMLAAKLEQVATRRIEFLADKLPKRPGPPDMPMGPDTWQPSDMQISTFARYVEAVENPAGVVERMADGTMTPEDAEALRAVYPEMYQDIRMGITKRLPQLQETLPYDKRLMLSIFFDTPVDPAMRPEVMAALQGNFAAEPGTEGGTQPAPARFASLRGNNGPKPTPAQDRAG